MVRSSYQQKPYRRILMETWGARVHASPSELTPAGRAVVAADPDSPGSIGIAISEAVEDALSRDYTRFALGSISNNVLLHQSVIGLEAKKQLEIAGGSPPPQATRANGRSPVPYSARRQCAQSLSPSSRSRCQLA